jgi:hypothetical protein
VGFHIFGPKIGQKTKPNRALSSSPATSLDREQEETTMQEHEPKKRLD